MKQERKFSFKMQTNITPYKKGDYVAINLVKTLKHSEKYRHKTGQIFL